MSVYDDDPVASAPPPSRTPLLLAVIGGGLVVAGAAFFFTRGDDAPPAATSAPAATARPAAAPPAKKAEPTPEPAAPAEAAPRRAATKTAPAADDAPAPAAPRADLATVIVESDVPGASVFVDREFVGTAPVTLKDVAPGTKRINVSAEGFEGVQRSVDVTPGEQTVTLRFKEVRLNASVGVAHKHGVGGCEGTLRATVDGLSYQTSNKGDAFTLPYAQVESFEVNYLEKNLRVKQRGGKTWNFTDKAAANADALFVFHRDVTAARDKLAKGFTAAR